jgi:hypothetical protein
MDQIQTLSTGRKLLLGAGALLFVFTFFAWQKIDIEFGGVTAVSAKANAWHGFWGVFMGILLIVLVVWVAAHTFGVAVPGGLPVGLTTAVLGVLVFVFALLKNLTDDYSAWASYVGLVLAALVAVGSVKTFQESGEAMPSMPQMAKSDSPAPASTSSAPAAPAAPSTPEPPAAPPAASPEPTPPANPEQQ